MTPFLNSTLDEINGQLENFVYDLLAFVAPEIWTERSHVVYSPVDDLEFANNLFERRESHENAQHILVPFSYISRATSAASGMTYDFARKPVNEWLARPAASRPSPGNDYQINFIPAQFQYTIKVYDSVWQNLEAIIDRILYKGIMHFSKTFWYESEVLHIRAPIVCGVGNPSYHKTQTIPSRTEKDGKLYGIVIPLEIACVLGESKPAKRIEQINVEYWMKGIYRVLPFPEGYIKVDGFVIDSNTVTKYPDPTLDGPPIDALGERYGQPKVGS